MKAPAKIDKALRASGFGYAKPYYLRHNLQAKLTLGWLFGKEAEGLTAQAIAFYPEGESGMGVSPVEIGCLYPDGRAAMLPDRDMLEAFWDPKDADALVSGLSGAGSQLLDRFCDADLMTRVYSFLIDPAAIPAAAPVEFPELCRPWVERKSTPNRLSGKAAYLTLMGQFDEAIQLLARIPAKLVGDGDRKILADAQARRVIVPPESLAYLRGIGARVE
jgi:hypothetical protein